MNANDAKDQTMISNNDQIPKECTLVTDSAETMSSSLVMTDKTTPTQNVISSTGVVAPDNVTQENVVSVPQQSPTSMESNAATVATERSKDLEAASPTKSQPVRKISRFLVSPAILTVANEKSVQNTCVEESVITTPTNVINQTPTVSTSANSAATSDYHQMPMQNQVSYLRKNARKIKISTDFCVKFIKDYE